VDIPNWFDSGIMQQVCFVSSKKMSNQFSYDHILYLNTLVNSNMDGVKYSFNQCGPIGIDIKTIKTRWGLRFSFSPSLIIYYVVLASFPPFRGVSFV